MAEDKGFRPAAWQRGWMDERSPREDSYEATREFRQGAFRRGADLGVQVTRSQFIRVLRNRHGIAVHLAKWATADGLPSDYWDARADAFAQVIEELEGVGRGNWWS